MRGYDLFVSHHQADAGAEASLISEILRKKGFRVFLDVDTHAVGDIASITRDALESSKAVILVVGRTFDERVQEPFDWVRRELRLARASEKKIIPILIGGGDYWQRHKTLPDDLAWLPEQRSLVFDRSRINSVVAEITEALGLRLRPAAASSLVIILALLVLAVALGMSIIRNVALESELAVERAKRTMADDQLREFKKKDEIKTADPIPPKAPEIAPPARLRKSLEWTFQDSRILSPDGMGDQILIHDAVRTFAGILCPMTKGQKTEKDTAILVFTVNAVNDHASSVEPSVRATSEMAEYLRAKLHFNKVNYSASIQVTCKCTAINR